jgi:predicted porin
MKNLLTMLMILAIALMATTAMAGDMTYKVYGKLHTSLNYVNDGDQTGLTMSSNTSRFGVKGGVELNENFTAIYQFENSLNIASRGGTLASRNSYLGVKGNFGTVLAGIHDTPFKTLGRKITFFKDTIGDFRTMTVGYDQRLANVLVYATPKNDMWGGQLAYQLDQNDWQTEDLESATAFSGMVYVTPMEGDLFIGAAYETWAAGYFMATEDEDYNSTGAFRVAAKYSAEKFAVSGLFQSVSDWYTIKGIDATTFGLEALFMAAEKWHLKGNFYNTTISAEGATEDTKVSQFALGVDHVFAPRTVIYLQMAMVNNGDYGSFGIGRNSVDTGGTAVGTASWSNGFGGGYGAAMKEDGSGYENPMAFSLGVAHTF